MTPVGTSPAPIAPTTTAINVCKNHGVWDGLKCICPSLYYGPLCEDVVENLEFDQTVSARVELSVTVTNRNYNDKLQNRSSEEFKEFNDTFTEQMKRTYSDIPEYAGVNITNLRPGSVVVEHEVLLKTRYTPAYKEVFQQLAEAVNKTIRIATSASTSINSTHCLDSLCFNPFLTMVQNLTVNEYNPEEECRKVAGEDYADYFTVQYKDQKAYCVSPCMAGFNISKNCHLGKCQLTKSGPRCFCPHTDTYWYTGDSCDLGVQKKLVYGLVGASGGVILLVLGILLVIALRSRRETQRQKFRVSQLYQWHEESGGSAPGTFWNTGFDISEDRENYICLDSLYSNFQPSLSHIDPETKIQIQRPQVIMTTM